MTRLFVLKVLVVKLHCFEFFPSKVSVSDSDSFESAKLFFSFFRGISIAGHDQIVHDNIVKILLAVVALALEVNHLGKAVKFAGAKWHNFFGSTLYDKTDMLGTVLKGVSNGHSLAVGAEWNPELKFVVTLALNKFLLHADVRVKEEVQDTNFDGATARLVLSVAHLHVGVAIEDAAVPEHVLDL